MIQKVLDKVFLIYFGLAVCRLCFQLVLFVFIVVFHISGYVIINGFGVLIPVILFNLVIISIIVIYLLIIFNIILYIPLFIPIFIIIFIFF